MKSTMSFAQHENARVSSMLQASAGLARTLPHAVAGPHEIHNR